MNTANPLSSILHPLSSASLVCGGNRGSWNWQEHLHDEATMNGIEAWVFALRGSYKAGIELKAEDLDAYDLIVYVAHPYVVKAWEKMGVKA